MRRTVVELVTFDQLATGDTVDMEDGYGLGTVESVGQFDQPRGGGAMPARMVRVRVGGLAYEGMYGYAQCLRVVGAEVPA